MATVYGDSKTAGKAVDYGLSSAQDWLKNNQNGYTGDYPSFTSYTAPTDMAYGVDYVSNPAYQTVGGITDQNWGQFQQQMRQPVYQSYDQNLRDIDQRFSNNGLYGSRGYGMNDSTLQKAGEGLMTGLLAADTAAQNQYLANQQFLADQNLNAWKTGLTDAERQQAYNQNKFAYDYQNAQNQVDFANSEAARRDAYNQDQFNFNYSQYRQPFQDYLSLASGAQPTANNQASNAASLAAAQQQADAAGTAAWGSALGSLGGGLLSSYGDNGWTVSGLFDGIGSLFG